MNADINALWRIYRAFSPKWTKYIPVNPHPKQHLFLCLDHIPEVFYGGAAGPGKTTALLMAALQYVDCPGYHALIIRRNYTELSQPGGLMDIAHDWLAGTDAEWDSQEHRWVFPIPGDPGARATLTFGHMDTPLDVRRYKGGQFQFVAIDEITDFDERSAMFFHSRLRRTTGQTVPLRFRAASNPGGIGHAWVKARYIDSTAPDRFYLPATMLDNPYLDRETYLNSLNRLDPITRDRLIAGNWDVQDHGGIFNRVWFTRFLDHPPIDNDVVARVRAWDLAVSTAADACETAGVKMSKTVRGDYVVEDVIHGKWPPGERDQIIHATARLDGYKVKVLIEEEGGSGGRAQNAAIAKLLAGWPVESIRLTGNKFVRAGPFASQVQAGNVLLVRGRWNYDYIEQLHVAGPTGTERLDMMDASTLAFSYLWPKVTRGSNICSSAGAAHDDRETDGGPPPSPWDAIRVASPYGDARR